MYHNLKSNFLKEHNEDRMNPDRPLIFLHIPKSAGTSMSKGLDIFLHPKHSIIGGFDSVVFGKFDDFKSINHKISSKIYVGTNYLPKAVDLVTGHFSYNTLINAYPHGQIITIMREPSSRLLSFWMYWRSYNDKQVKMFGTWGKRILLARKSFKEFLNASEIYCQTDNITTRMILYPHRLIPLDRAIDPLYDNQLLIEARRIINKLAFVDIIENPKFLNRLSTWLGGSFELQRENVTGAIPLPFRRNLHNEFDQETLELLEKRTRLDRILWHDIISKYNPDLDSSVLERSIVIEKFTLGTMYLFGLNKKLNKYNNFKIFNTSIIASKAKYLFNKFSKKA